ncbi:Ferroxidase [Bertholletia excelsa]
MLLRSPPSLSLSSLKRDSNDVSIFPPDMICSLKCWRHSSALRFSRRNVSGSFVINASKEDDSKLAFDAVFKPFEEVEKELSLVAAGTRSSLARQKFSELCEAALNEQINVEYNVSYVYHAMYAYFDRDNVALKGLAKYFKDASVEEREHAEKFMEYQNKRGGRIKLQSILKPVSEFDHVEKGDALHAMELALSLEKLTNEKLLNLHKVASESNDVQLADFVESEFLNEQVEAIKKVSEFVAELRRMGKGHGVWHFDQMLLRGLVNGA